MENPKIISGQIYDGKVVNRKAEMVVSTVAISLFLAFMIFIAVSHPVKDSWFPIFVVVYVIFMVFGQIVVGQLFNKKGTIKIENKTIVVDSELGQKRIAFSPDIKVEQVVRHGKHGNRPQQRVKIQNQEGVTEFELKDFFNAAKFIAEYFMAAGVQMPEENDKIGNFLNKKFSLQFKSLESNIVEKNTTVGVEKTSNGEPLRPSLAVKSDLNVSNVQFSKYKQLGENQQVFDQGGPMVQDDRGKQILKFIIILVLVVAAYLFIKRFY